MKRIIPVLTVVLLLCLPAACGSGKNASASKDAAAARPAKAAAPPVLIVEDQRFTIADFQEYLSSRYADIKLDDSRPGVLSRLFDNFVEYRILLYSADQAGVTVSPEELPELTEKLNLPADSVPRPVLMEMARIQKYLYFHYFSHQEVTEAEIQEYYRNHRNEFIQDPEVYLYQILLPDKEQAIELRGILLNSPDRFEELARTRSISPEASSNGYMGIFEKGTLPKEMENVVFSLRPHQISPVVESKFGFHIFKVTRRNNRRTLPLQRVHDQIQRDLMAAKLRSAYSAMLQKAAASLRVRRFPQNLGFHYSPETGESTHETSEDSHDKPAAAGPGGPDSRG